MTELTLIPHDGIEIQSIGKIRFGQTANEVERTLGAPSFKDDMRYFYDDYEISVMFSTDKKVEAIECNAGPFSDKTRTVIYGADFFSLSADEVIDLMEKMNNASIFIENPGRPKKSIWYIEIDVGVWRDIDEADAEESVKEAINSGVYEMDKDSYDNEVRKARHFRTVLIGRKDYYRDSLAS